MPLAVVCVVGGWHVVREGLEVRDAALYDAGRLVGTLVSLAAAQRVFARATAPLCAAPPAADTPFGAGVFVEGDRAACARFDARFVASAPPGAPFRAAWVLVTAAPRAFVASTAEASFPLPMPVAPAVAFCLSRMPPDALYAIAQQLPQQTFTLLTDVCAATVAVLAAEGVAPSAAEAARHAQLGRLWAGGYALELADEADAPPPAVRYDAPPPPPAAGDALGLAAGSVLYPPTARVLAAALTDARGTLGFDRAMALADPQLPWAALIVQTLFPASLGGPAATAAAASLAAWRAACAMRDLTA